MFPTWIANPIMVWKDNGAWRMCIDYSHLNNTCLKDCYPLSEIDQKVHSLEGSQLKCFLDAYKGYHQRLMDNVFTNRIGQNIEVYVDDMVIKSHNEEMILQDVEETFKSLAKVQMKLNPAKCTFRVDEGQFHGYQVEIPDAIKRLPTTISVDPLELEVGKNFGSCTPMAQQAKKDQSNPTDIPNGFIPFSATWHSYVISNRKNENSMVMSFIDRKTLQNSADDYPKIVDLLCRFAIHHKNHGAGATDVHSVAMSTRLDAIISMYGVSIARSLMKIEATFRC
ncbi:unnamed protein product [Lactuca saligna]|uniref:Reverse transcriptase domain-containing protein n=1 Tax=Lactuca saligna TaxID=75948 RepID=A0AA35ZKA5_LACSI|nr:unnamed protein product [Lactuca saligna]